MSYKPSLNPLPLLFTPPPPVTLPVCTPFVLTPPPRFFPVNTPRLPPPHLPASLPQPSFAPPPLYGGLFIGRLWKRGVFNHPPSPPPPPSLTPPPPTLAKCGWMGGKVRGGGVNSSRLTLRVGHE